MQTEHSSSDQSVLKEVTPNSIFIIKFNIYQNPTDVIFIIILHFKDNFLGQVYFIQSDLLILLPFEKFLLERTKVY